MGKKAKMPCRNIVTFRVNDEEKINLEKLASEHGANISSLMRVILKKSLNHQDFKKTCIGNHVGTH